MQRLKSPLLQDEGILGDLGPALGLSADHDDAAQLLARRVVDFADYRGGARHIMPHLAVAVRSKVSLRAARSWARSVTKAARGVCCSSPSSAWGESGRGWGVSRGAVARGVSQECMHISYTVCCDSDSFIVRDSPLGFASATAEYQAQRLVINNGEKFKLSKCRSVSARKGYCRSPSPRCAQLSIPPQGMHGVTFLQPVSEFPSTELM